MDVGGGFYISKGMLETYCKQFGGQAISLWCATIACDWREDVDFHCLGVYGVYHGVTEEELD